MENMTRYFKIEWKWIDLLFYFCGYAVEHLNEYDYKEQIVDDGLEVEEVHVAW